MEKEKKVWNERQTQGGVCLGSALRRCDEEIWANIIKPLEDGNEYIKRVYINMNRTQLPPIIK